MTTGQNRSPDKTTPEPGGFKDVDLVRRACEGDWRASERLILRHQDRAFAVAFRMCDGDREKALELTQEAFLAALKNLKKFKQKSSFYTWFYRILVNTVLDERRRFQRRRKLFFSWKPGGNAREDTGPADIESYPDAKAPASAINAGELYGDIHNALKLLTNKQKMVFQLKAFEEMAISEIADVMGMAEGTVKSHLFRATRIMRDALSEWSRP